MGGGVRSYEMARRLVERGHIVHVVTTDQQAPRDAPTWRESMEAGIHVHWTPVPYDNKMGYTARLRAFLSFAWSAARKAATLQSDVVFATSTPLTVALPAVYAARRLKCPMVFEVRDLWPAVPIAIGAIRDPASKWLARRLERYAYDNAERIVALAPGMGAEIVAAGYPQERVAVIPNGSDLELLSDPSVEREIRSDHDWLGERRLLVYTGAFGRVNGMGYLVKLAAAMARRDPEVRVVGVGDGKEFERTRELAAAMGVLDKQLFLLGKRPKRETAAWLQTADMSIALFTGPEIVWRDAVQNKFFDSLAVGTPVANNFAGWQSRLAVEASAGLILSAVDFDSAADDVLAALRDTRWLANAGRAARHLAETRFDRSNLAADLEQVLLAARDRER